MDLNNGMQLLSAWIVHIGDFGLYLLWCSIHLLVSLWYIVSDIAEALESCLISLGLINQYGPIDVSKLQNLAIVVETEEAQDVLKVVKLLQWLQTIGVKHVSLFDSQGLLKKSKEVILETVSGSMLLKEIGEKDCSSLPKCITLEFLSASDNKEAMAKAANVLLERYLKSRNLGNDKEENVFTEAHLTEALTAIGDSGHQPDLLLVYGPVRSHQGFPAWRLRYTEIVHMGSLKHMRYDSLVKEIYKFTRVHQNYGT